MDQNLERIFLLGFVWLKMSYIPLWESWLPCNRTWQQTSDKDVECAKPTL